MVKIWVSHHEPESDVMVSKDCNADSLLEHERTHHYLFPRKNVIVNSAFHSHLRINWMTLLLANVVILSPCGD